MTASTMSFHEGQCACEVGHSSSLSKSIINATRPIYEKITVLGEGGGRFSPPPILISLCQKLTNQRFTSSPRSAFSQLPNYHSHFHILYPLYMLFIMFNLICWCYRPTNKTDWLSKQENFHFSVKIGFDENCTWLYSLYFIFQDNWT